MNLALGAFILTLLFLPAITFRLAVNRLENLKGLLSILSITDSIWVFTIIPIITHAGLLLLLRSIGVTTKFDLILNIIYANSSFPLNNQILEKDLIKFLGYNFLAIIVGFFSGFLMNTLEHRWKLISKFWGLRNEWYEAFEGDLLGINSTKIDAVYVDVLVNTRESSILYSGFLVKYYFKPRSTELEYLVLQEVTRRDLRKTYRTDNLHIESGKSSFYDLNTGESKSMNGNYLILPMEEVLNVNISYIYLGLEENKAS